MGVFESVVDKLNEARKADPNAEHFETEVEQDDIRVRVKADDFGRLGIHIHELSIEGPEPGGDLGECLHRQADALAQLDTPPLTHLKPIEIDGRLGAGVMRTKPDEIHRGHYYEAGLQGGRKVSIKRYHRDPETKDRSLAPFTATEETLDEVVDAIGGVLRANPTSTD